MTEKKLSDFFEHYSEQIKKYAKKSQPISPETVYQDGIPELQALINEILDTLVAPDSCFKHADYLETFLQSVKDGKSAIILPEHYSNLDYPIFLYLLAKSGVAGAEIAKRCVPIAGMKLTEENPSMALVTQAYSHINIYPGRSLEAISDPKIFAVEEKRSRAINLASMRALKNAKDAGKIIVVFPAGTRYRPGKPETKRGLREIDSYIKSFDIMMPVSINGNCLRISNNPTDMFSDILVIDTIIMEAATPCTTKDFRAKALTAIPATEDQKQTIVDYLMTLLEKMHIRNEKK